MIDNEIIKALELCFTDNFGDCEGCPLKDKRYDIFSCMRTKQELTLDLINRQKAEIEEYKYALEEIKAEAIKEFAERVKAISKTDDESIVLCTVDVLDNLVKEMVGDAE